MTVETQEKLLSHYFWKKLMNMLLCTAVLVLGISAFLVSAMRNQNNWLTDFRFMTVNGTLYTVLIVEYADSVVPARDSAKAQSLAFSMTTIGSVLASLVGGRMFDAVGVKPTMLTAVGIAAVGCAVALMGTFGKKKA